MNRFAQRSDQKELLDGDALPFHAIKQNMQELEVINKRLGGHKVTVDALHYILQQYPGKHSWHIVEIGSGGGDNLAAMEQWAKKKDLSFYFTGVDNNPNCVEYAKSRNPAMEFISEDYRHVRFESKPDIVFSSLFCHHFSDDELVDQLTWMQANSTTGFFINDLHRHPLAFFSIRALTALFSESFLVKNDAPLSVLRGFRKREWLHLFSRAGVLPSRMKWKWAFRWQIIFLTPHADNGSI